MQTIKLSFEISIDAFKLLTSIKEKGAAEYRDSEWDSLEDFKKSDVFLNGIRDEDWYLSRNFNGTGYLLHELLRNGLVDADFQSWHPTYILSHLGKEVLENLLNQ